MLDFKNCEDQLKINYNSNLKRTLISFEFFQSITSPISSPVVQMNSKDSHQNDQTTKAFGSFLKSKTRNAMTEQMNFGVSNPQIIPNT